MRTHIYSHTHVWLCALRATLALSNFATHTRARSHTHTHTHTRTHARRWQLMIQLERSFEMQSSMGIQSEGESDEVKRVFLEGNPYLLVRCFCKSCSGRPGISSHGSSQPYTCGQGACVCTFCLCSHFACIWRGRMMVCFPGGPPSLAGACIHKIVHTHTHTHTRTHTRTQPHAQALTMAVSLLHTVFDMLAFKNDIGFWKNNKVGHNHTICLLLMSAVCL